MLIIDAHLHAQQSEHFDRLCAGIGLPNTLSGLRQAMAEADVATAVAMGTSRGSHSPNSPGVPDIAGLAQAQEAGGVALPYCLGVLPEQFAGERRSEALAQYRAEAIKPGAVGFKLYAGYNHYYVYDPLYYPLYELAEELGLPVVIHTGDTSNAAGRLRYSHPLTVDEAAVLFPRVSFVMAHAGNPWFADAAEVAKKNPNVCLDLSGLAVGRIDVEGFLRRYAGYVSQLETWLGYLDDYTKVLYGTDWPLTDMKGYSELIRRVIPQEAWEAVFGQNALRVFPKLRASLPRG